MENTYPDQRRPKRGYKKKIRGGGYHHVSSRPSRHQRKTDEKLRRESSFMADPAKVIENLETSSRGHMRSAIPIAGRTGHNRTPS